MDKYLHLKNGSDVRGVALATGGLPVTLTQEAVTDISSAFALWVAERTRTSRPVIAVGQDPRLSSEAICGWVTDGIARAGGKIVLTGLSSTPAMYMFLKEYADTDASVMITASHLPRDRNGLKFFTREGGIESGELEKVLGLASALPPLSELPAETERRPFLHAYAARLAQKVRTATGEKFPLAGKRILVDAGNGAGGFYADVLKSLGADTTGSQFLDPDGNFPNHIPNPEDGEAMRSVSEAVKRHRADLGIIFDTDVDRAGAVAADGKEINRNRLIALISAILLSEHPGAYIVTDSVTSDGLTAFIKARGGVHRRFKRGYKNVINEAKRLCAEGHFAPLAIETSGHAALIENDFLDDGAYLVTRLLIALARESRAGRDLLSLIEDLPEPLEAREVRIGLDAKSDYHAAGMGIICDFKRYAESVPYLSLAPDQCEGVRVNFDRAHGNGWMLVRMSLHEPVLPVNAESDSVGGTLLMLKELYRFLKGRGLDLTHLETIIKE